VDPLATIVAAAGGLVTLSAAGLAVNKFGRVVLRTGRQVGELADDWRGEPDRPGVPGRAGVMERLAALEVGQTAINKELRPNGGSSLRDAVNRCETKLDDHIASHGQQQPVQVNVGMPQQPTSQS
jgi:hypothetical protein